jgi:beta-aspartyl-peptidase (threonine type)
MTRIIVHGGAGNIRAKTAHRRGVRRAALAGRAILQGGGSALDAVVGAVVTMEDDDTFNCGLGSALTLEGKAEMDAAVMLDDLSCGAVGALEGVRNPILVARQVMERTDHVLLVGQGARRLARQMGFRPFDAITEKRKRQRARLLVRLKSGTNPPYLPNLASYARPEIYGTVGAVSLDQEGRIAAATSTGGMMLHLSGRVGDTPLIGAGTYADEHGGVSATGWGEKIMKLIWAARAAEFMKRLPAQEAVDRAMQLANKNGCRGGLIAMDRRGNVGIGFNTPVMSWAYVDGDDVVVF